MIFRVFDGMTAAIEAAPKPRNDWVIKRSAVQLATSDHIFDLPADAHAFVDLLFRLPIGAIAIDTEYCYRSPSVKLRGGATWYDPTTLDPLILTAAAWVPSESQIIRFLLDLRVPGMAAVVDHLLRIRTTFVAHNFKAEFQTFWALGFDPVLVQTYDTYVAARALLLGRGHRNIQLRRDAIKAENWDGLADADVQLASLLSLAGQCEAYRVKHPYGGSKALLQKSFLDHPEGGPFTRAQMNYALADADCTLQVYLAQHNDVLAAGLHAHLHEVEFPFAEANARMEFDGVPVAREKLFDLADGLGFAAERELEALRGYGLDNPGSSQQVIALLGQRGWTELMNLNGKLTSQDKVLEQLESLDPAVAHIRAYRRYKALLGGQLLSGELIGSDGRLHPNHRHLGAETGRNTCSAPNVVGLPRTFRPIVEAPAGRAIIEADYCQIEVGIAAAEAGDVALIDAFNSGDVYAAVAQSFYRSDLTEEERNLTVSDFKRTRPDLRDHIKIFVLATLYNMQDQAIADRFAISATDASRQRAAFLDQYPGVRSMMVAAEQNGRIRGFAPAIGGLRRHILPGRGASNQHINTPVQASAGVVFRKAVVDLHRYFRGTPTRLILPVHDAVVVECNAEDVAYVASDLAHIMTQAVRRYYPSLRPVVDVNDKDPTCWNKDGHSESLIVFLEEARAASSTLHPISTTPDLKGRRHA